MSPQPPHIRPQLHSSEFRLKDVFPRQNSPCHLDHQCSPTVGKSMLQIQTGSRSTRPFGASTPDISCIYLLTVLWRETIMFPPQPNPTRLVEEMSYRIPDRHIYASNLLAFVSILGMCFADWQASRSSAPSFMFYPSTYQSRRDRRRPLTGMPLRSSELAFKR